LTRSPLGRIAVLAAAVALAACSGGGTSMTDPAPSDAPFRADTSYGREGVAEIGFGAGYAAARDAAGDGDGVVVAGVLPGQQPGIARLTSAGGRDGGFGEGGLIRPPFEGDVIAVAVAGDLVYAAGSQAGAIVVARYTRSGHLDTAFGDGGVARAAFTGASAVPFALRIDSGGRVVAAGAVGDPTDIGSNTLAVARFLPTGHLDDAFAARSTRATRRLPAARTPGSLVIGEDGSVAVAVTVARAPADAPAHEDVGIVRLTADGDLDRAYGDNGVAVADPGTPSGAAVALVTAPGGALVAVANRNVTGTKPEVVLVRYDSAGKLDTTFGQGGFVTAAAAPLVDAADAVVVGRGRIAVAARVADDVVRSDPEWRWALLLFGRDGELVEGGAVVRIGAGYGVARAVQTEDGLVFVGCSCPFPARDRGPIESDSVMRSARFTNS
jgi:uncharacterized delta-60 repeat protein